MKRTIALTMLACGLAFAQAPPAPPTDPVIQAIKDENEWLKKKTALLQQRMAFYQYYIKLGDDLAQLEAQKPKQEAVPLVPPKANK